MTNNTTAQRKRTKGQTIQQPKEKEKDKRTNNTTAQRKRIT